MSVRTLILIVIVTFGLECSEASPLCKVNGASNWYPVIYWQDGQTPRGIGVDLLQRFAQQHKVSLVFGHPQHWVRTEHQLSTGDLDVIAGAYFNERRNNAFVYSDAFHTETISIFVPKNKTFEFQQWRDLQGLIGLRPASGSYGEAFDNFASQHLDIQQNADMVTGMRMLLADRADYIVLAKDHGEHLIKTLKLANKVTSLPHPVTQNKVYFMFHKNSPCLELLPKLNHSIKSKIPH